MYHVEIVTSPDTARLACQGTLPGEAAAPPMILVRAEAAEAADLPTLLSLEPPPSSRDGRSGFLDVVFFCFLFPLLRCCCLVAVLTWPHLQPAPAPGLGRTQDTEHRNLSPGEPWGRRPSYPALSYTALHSPAVPAPPPGPCSPPARAPRSPAARGAWRRTTAAPAATPPW